MKDSLGSICHQIALGRQLARRLSAALRGEALGEAEFRLLWLLRQEAARGLEQRGLADQLGVSPAQVSSLVEKLRQQRFIEPFSDQSDRRRQYWRLTPVGCQQLEAVVTVVESRLADSEQTKASEMRLRPPREDAA